MCNQIKKEDKKKDRRTNNTHDVPLSDLSTMLIFRLPYTFFLKNFINKQKKKKRKIRLLACVINSCLQKLFCLE